MKKTFLVLLGLLVIEVSLFAQSSAVTNAALYHKDNQLGKAVEEINKAVEHEKTKDDPKAWYYRGLIYQSLIDTKDPSLKALSDKPEKESLESYQKAITFDKSKRKEYANLSKQNMQVLFPAFINAGYIEYNEGKYQSALQYFEDAQNIKPDDTTGYVYASYAAEELKRYDLINNYLKKLDSLNYKSPQTYYYKVTIAADQDKNPEEALQISRQALQAYPGNLQLLQEQTNLFILLDKSQDAINNLKILTSLKPTDADYLTMLASLYDQTGEKEKALAYYQKTLQVNPTNFLALYNSSLIYYEEGKALNEEIHKMPMNEYHNTGKQKEQEEDQIFSKAMGFAKKAKLAATDETDKKNVDLLMGQINKVLADENVYKSLHK